MEESTTTSEMQKNYDEHVQEFTEAFHSRRTGKRNFFLPKELYDNIVKALAVDGGKSKSWEGVTSRQRRKALENYALYTYPTGEQRLVTKNGRFIVHDQELISIVAKAHWNRGRAPPGSLSKYLERTYYGIS